MGRNEIAVAPAGSPEHGSVFGISRYFEFLFAFYMVCVRHPQPTKVRVIDLGGGDGASGKNLAEIARAQLATGATCHLIDLHPSPAYSLAKGDTVHEANLLDTDGLCRIFSDLELSSPGRNLFLLKDVIHFMNAEEAETLIAKIVENMKSGDRIMISTCTPWSRPHLVGIDDFDFDQYTLIENTYTTVVSCAESDIAQAGVPIRCVFPNVEVAARQDLNHPEGIANIWGYTPLFFERITNSLGLRQLTISMMRNLIFPNDLNTDAGWQTKYPENMVVILEKE